MLVSVCNGATFESYVLPQSHVSQRILVDPGVSSLPSKATAYSAAQSAPLPVPTVTLRQLPTEVKQTGTKVTVHHEPVERHGYIIRY